MDCKTDCDIHHHCADTHCDDDQALHCPGCKAPHNYRDVCGAPVYDDCPDCNLPLITPGGVSADAWALTLGYYELADAIKVRDAVPGAQMLRVERVIDNRVRMVQYAVFVSNPDSADADPFSGLPL